MQQLPIPQKIEWKSGPEKNEATVMIEPCYPGYGTTLGTVLRRVLLSSLEGAAPVAVKIKGALHEFSAIPSVKEDTMEILLAIKRIHFKLFTDEEVRLTLKTSGAKEVKAKDIDKDALVEIINPSTPIATLTSKDAELEMEIFVRKGRGYLAVEERNREEREIGKIFIDALFSPVVNIGFKIENVRVGEITNYERLNLTITTDGTITPEEAYSQAIEILKSQLEALKKIEKLDDSKIQEEKSEEVKKEIEVSPEELTVVSEEAKKEEVIAKEPVKESEQEEKPKRKRGRPKKTE